MNRFGDNEGVRIDTVGGVTIAVEGCCHGELDTIYAEIAAKERQLACKVELLLVCGDFQCVRDAVDLQCLAVPHKYRRLNTFHHYATGEKIAPVLTVFIGGNHEASNVLQSLYYGGFVAPNVYFLGFAGVVRFKSLRIAGLSGIFNERHYRMGHFEVPPYSDGTLRSVYHLRELEVYRLMHLMGPHSPPVDIFLSHDWPLGIWEHGNKQQLLRTKPYFREDMESGKLGSPPLMHLLRGLRPSHWFAAHLHVKFRAEVWHTPDGRPPLPLPPRPPLPPLPLPPASTLAAAPVKERSDDAEIALDEPREHDDFSSSASRSAAASDAELPTAAAERPTKTHFLALDKVVPKR